MTGHDVFHPRGWTRGCRPSPHLLCGETSRPLDKKRQNPITYSLSKQYWRLKCLSARRIRLSLRPPALPAFAIDIAGVTLQPLPVLDAATLMIHRSAFAGTHTMATRVQSH